MVLHGNGVTVPAQPIPEKNKTMKQSQYRQLPETERLNFYRCPACREMVDRRRMDEVIIHHSHVLHPNRWHFDGRDTRPRRAGGRRPAEHRPIPGERERSKT